MGDGESQTVTFDINDVARMEVELCGSGAIDDLNFYDVVPAVPLMETATVTVVVEGEGGDIAVADAFTVQEGEDFGDIDGNVLTNDIDGNNDGSFDIVEANGNPNWVGAIIQGSNGGLAVLNPDGSFDFSANGEFDALNDGESADTVFTYAISSGGGTVADGLVIPIDGPNGLNARITVIEQNGELVVTVEVFSDGGDIGDIRGLFFDVADESLLSGMSASGYDVTDQRFDANNVVDLGAGNNVSGDIVLNLGAFDAATELGTQGIGRDDIRATTFKLTHDTTDLTLDLLMNQDFALRLTSVGEEGGSRDDSLKLGATSGSVTTEVSTATVTVTVEGETHYVAQDDVLTVMESEEAGDLEMLDDGSTTVLANDTQDGGAYLGQVQNAGIQVAGSNGGLATIYADGTIDFDANDEFDFLADGESATTTFSYEIGGGEMADVTVNVLGEDDPAGGETINIAIMLNTAQTMYATALGTVIGVPAYPDINGDGLANQLMDMAYFMLNDFMADAFTDAANLGVTLNVSLISFGSGGGGEGSDYWTVSDAASWAGQLDAKVQADGSSDHGNGFVNADAWFDTVSTPTSTNAVFVVSDGFSSDPWLQERADLITNHDAQLEAYFPDLDIGSAGGVAALNAMDKDGYAEQVWTDDAAFAASLGSIAAQDVLDLNNLIA